MLIAEVPPPVLIPVGEVAIGLFALCTFVAFAGVNHGWNATFGWALRWVANELDKLELSIRWIGHIRPFGPLASGMRWLDHQVRNLTGGAALRSQHAATYMFNQAAAQFRYIGREIQKLSGTLFNVTHTVIHTTLPRVERRVIARTRTIVRGAEHRVTVNVSRVRHELRADVKALHRAVVRAQAAGAHALDWSEAQVGRLGRRVRATERDLSKLNRTLAGAAFAAIVWTALRRLGLKWLRCGNSKRAAKAVCGMDASLFEDLLGGATALFGIISIEEFARELQPVVGEMAHQVHNVWANPTTKVNSKPYVRP